jgi:hypothetical protein
MPDESAEPQQPAGGDWESQARAAATRIAELETKVSQLDQLVLDTKAALNTTERRRSIEREALEAHAIDIESVALLAESAAAGLAEPNIPGIITDLRRKKPFLFSAAPRTSAMSPTTTPAPTHLEDAATTARRTGDPRALLHYLRLRRQT